MALSQTGTDELLRQLSPFVPDDLINQLCHPPHRKGRPAHFSAAQLFRVNLLALLTPAHSFNLLLRLLKEIRGWRDFARLRNRHLLPDAKMLNVFRGSLHLSHLRTINEFLLAPLLEGLAGFEKTVALIDATDLPAATNTFKKRWFLFSPTRHSWGAQPEEESKSLVCWL